jgi:hypothetical protein
MPIISKANNMDWMAPSSFALFGFQAIDQLFSHVKGTDYVLEVSVTGLKLWAKKSVNFFDIGWKHVTCIGWNTPTVLDLARHPVARYVLATLPRQRNRMVPGVGTNGILKACRETDSGARDRGGERSREGRNVSLRS